MFYALVSMTVGFAIQVPGKTAYDHGPVVEDQPEIVNARGLLRRLASGNPGHIQNEFQT